MPTQTTIKRTITIKKYTITRSVVTGKSSTQSTESALAQAMSDLTSNIPNSSAKQ
jgi:hypothetical protein